MAGQGLLDLLDVRVGDWVRMTVGGRSPRSCTSWDAASNRRTAAGVISTSLDTLRENDPGLRPDPLPAPLRPDADPHQVAAELTSVRARGSWTSTP